MKVPFSLFYEIKNKVRTGFFIINYYFTLAVFPPKIKINISLLFTCNVISVVGSINKKGKRFSHEIIKLHAKFHLILKNSILCSLSRAGFFT